MTARKIAWVSHGNPRGYSRKHLIEAPDDCDSLFQAYVQGNLPRRTKCGVAIPNAVIDIAEDPRTLPCNRCFP